MNAGHLQDTLSGAAFMAIAQAQDSVGHLQDILSCAAFITIAHTQDSAGHLQDTLSCATFITIAQTQDSAGHLQDTLSCAAFIAIAQTQDSAGQRRTLAGHTVLRRLYGDCEAQDTSPRLAYIILIATWGGVGRAGGAGLRP